MLKKKPKTQKSLAWREFVAFPEPLIVNNGLKFLLQTIGAHVNMLQHLPVTNPILMDKASSSVYCLRPLQFYVEFLINKKGYFLYYLVME